MTAMNATGGEIVENEVVVKLANGRKLTAESLADRAYGSIIDVADRLRVWIPREEWIVSFKIGKKEYHDVTLETAAIICLIHYYGKKARA